MGRAIAVLLVLMFCNGLVFCNVHNVRSHFDQMKIKAMIEMAAPFDTILFDSGTYHIQNITINKPLMVKGSDRSIIESLSGDEIFLVLSDSVTIQGFHLKGVKTSYITEPAAIRIVKSKHFTISQNLIEDCFFGIYLEHVDSGKVIGNVIKGNYTNEASSGNAIHAWYCSHLYIEKNEVTGHRDGIYFEFVDESLIIDNSSYKNLRYGLHFMFSNTDKYMKNIFHNNGSGVAVMFSKEIEMTENIFATNWGGSSYGLLLKEMNDAQIKDNVFQENTIGIYVEGCNRIEYHHNDFIHNGWAIKFSGGCYQNAIQLNNFMYNTMDLIFVTKMNDNIINGNYWSGYTGYDLDNNDIGDIPYYPVKLFSYVLQQVPEAIVLMRSFFVHLINFAERISPVFTPKDVFDSNPSMEPIQ